VVTRVCWLLDGCEENGLCKSALLIAVNVTREETGQVRRGVTMLLARPVGSVVLASVL
jgi:hypothetical protein